MNKKSLLTLLGASSLLVMAGWSVNALAGTATGSGTATIIAPVSVLADAQQLNFGTISSDSNGGSVLVSPDGATVTHTGVADGGGTPQGGSFTVTGVAGATISVSTPASFDLIAVGFSGGVDMPVNSIVTAVNGVVGATGVLAGGDKVTVGGTLTVGNDQAADTYVGSYTLTVNYQ